SGMNSDTAVVDSLLGVVRWTSQLSGDSVTLTAKNSAGSASQTFNLPVFAVEPSPNWLVVSAEETNRKSMQLFAADGKTLWMTQDTAIVARSTDAGATWSRSLFPADSLGPA